jgi:hypothetical protein
MSQNMNVATAPVGTSVQPPAARWWAAIVGVAVAAVLGYGAAMVVTGHVPWVEHSAATVEAAGVAEAQPAPAVANAAGDDALVGSRATTRSASDEALQRVTAGSVSAGSVNHGAVDPFETRLVSPQLQAAVGAAGGEGLISRRLATQSVAGAGGLSLAEIGELRAQDMVEYFESQSLEPTVVTYETPSEISGSDFSTGVIAIAHGSVETYVRPEYR